LGRKKRRGRERLTGLFTLTLTTWLAVSSFSYTVKKSFSIFPSPAGMSLTKLSLGGNNDVIYKLFPPRESLVSDIPAVDGNIEKLFLRCSSVTQQ
jgi:hypothetical protein